MYLATDLLYRHFFSVSSSLKLYGAYARSGVITQTH